MISLHQLELWLEPLEPGSRSRAEPVKLTIWLESPFGLVSSRLVCITISNPSCAPLGRVAGTIPIVLFTCADAGQQIAMAFQQACDELGEDLVRFPRLLPFSACFLTCEIA
jgi:hypothetical protein